KLGPAALGQLTISPTEFAVDGSTCAGDSGGPAFAEESNAVVGVLSRGGEENASQVNPAACNDAKDLYVKTSAFKDLILEGYARAEAEPWLEGAPDPRKLKGQEPCTTDDECQSSLCLPDPDAQNAMRCAEDCSATTTCSLEADVCTTEGTRNVCRAKP